MWCFLERTEWAIIRVVREVTTRRNFRRGVRHTISDPLRRVYDLTYALPEIFCGWNDGVSQTTRQSFDRVL